MPISTSIEHKISRIEELEQEVARLRSELKLVKSVTGYLSKTLSLESEQAQKNITPPTSSVDSNSNASLLSSESSELGLKNSSSSNQANEMQRELSFRIQVETAVFATVPKSMQIAQNHMPCCVLAVLDDETNVVKWRFAKTATQLRDFYEHIRDILGVKLRSGEIKLPPFPSKTLFNTYTPWKVDVRRDMVNSFFQSFAKIYQALKKDDRNLFERVRIALNELWLSDTVEVPFEDSISEDRNNNPTTTITTSTTDNSTGEKRGYLLYNTHCQPKWVCCYCVINGCFLDIVCNQTDGPITTSIDLRNATVNGKVGFFDATEDDERYAIQITEDTENGPRNYSLTAESDVLRKDWITKLRLRIKLCSNGTYCQGWRRYHPDDLPLPYQLIKNSRYHPPNHIFNAVNVNGADPSSGSLIKFMQKSDTSSSFGKSRTTVNSHDRSNSGDSSENINLKNNTGIDGEEFCMKISKPIDCQKLDDLACSPDSKGHNYKNLPEIISTGARVLQNPSKIVHGFSEFRPGQGSFNSMAVCGPLGPSKGIPRGLTRKVANGNSSQIFGVMPSQCKHLITLSTGDQVPSVVARCVRQLDHPAALAEVGIFRISGSQKLIDELEDEFETKGDAILARNNIDVHTIADLLKRYLRSLPEGLFGSWSGEKTMKLMHLPESEKISILRLHVMHMDPLNRGTVRTILRLLYNIIRKEASNKMSVVNLSQALNTALGVPINILVLFIKYQKEILGQ